MTDKVNPSFNSRAGSFETAGVLAKAGSSEGYIQYGDKPTQVSVHESELDETAYDAFSQTNAGLDVTIAPGEAIVYGAWLARDVDTVVTVPDDSTTTIYLGWDSSAGNTVIIGPDADFAPKDQRIELFEVTTAGGSVSSVEDNRRLGEHVSSDIVKADDGVLTGNELEEGKRLVVESDESMVVGGSYEINGDATLDGNLVTVPNVYSHDDLKDIDPTDHLEVVKEYHITASSDSQPAFDGVLTNAWDKQRRAFDVTVAPTNGLSQTYGFNFDFGQHWNNGKWDIPVTINWDEQPSDDLRLTVRVHKRT